MSQPDEIIKARQDIEEIEENCSFIDGEFHERLRSLATTLTPLVIGVLGDPNHPMARGVAELNQRYRDACSTEERRRAEEAEGLANKVSTDSCQGGQNAQDQDANFRRRPKTWKPEQLYFTPHPHSRGTDRQLAPCQLLLLLVASSPGRLQLAAHINVQVDELLPAATAAAACTTMDWSVAYWVENLRKALKLLEQVKPPQLFADGTLRWGSKKLLLRGQPHVMAKLLLNQQGVPIPYKVFEDAGIDYPRRAKSLLAAACRKHGIPFKILSNSPGTYMYTAP